MHAVRAVRILYFQGPCMLGISMEVSTSMGMVFHKDPNETKT